MATWTRSRSHSWLTVDLSWLKNSTPLCPLQDMFLRLRTTPPLLIILLYPC
jgi:hypothetical protein